MTGRHQSSDHIHQPRRDSMYEDHVQDPYIARGKLTEPTVCPDCRAAFHKGRWQWGESPTDAQEHRCPACQRIHDHMPAGILTASGEFFTAHREEIMHLIHNLEAKEKAQHPLERIMNSKEEAGELVIHFTSHHLTQATGEALHHAYHGDLSLQHVDKDNVMHVGWSR